MVAAHRRRICCRRRGVRMFVLALFRFSRLLFSIAKAKDKDKGKGKASTVKG